MSELTIFKFAQGLQKRGHMARKPSKRSGTEVPLRQVMPAWRMA